MNSQCSIAILESALAGNLSKEDETSLHRHLEECDECGAVLERLAGGPAWCQEAAALLTGDELDAAVPMRDDWSAVDFTVEHLEPADEPNVLGRLGGYDVLEIIGHGGMGVVLKAFDRELKRCVAIKVLAPHLAQSSLAKKRFAREAQAAAAIVHPHVLAIHQVQPAGRLPFLVMPLVAGESLAERLTAQGTLELKEVLRIGMQAAAGLAAAHEQGLVHRDVKPANILLEKGVERAVLTDFGLARAADDVTLTRWGIIAGTPQYMSPEQAQGEPLDGRSDLFSLGCVLYEMATGFSPFRSDSMMATLRRLVDDSPRAMASLNPELPPWFIAIVERLLEKDPSRRFGSAKEVSELLEGCLAHVQQPGTVPLPAALANGARRRARWPLVIRLIGVLAMIVACGIGLLGIFLLSADPPDIAEKTRAAAPANADHDEPGPPAGKTTAIPVPRLMFRVHTRERVTVVAYSPDGKTLAIGGDPKQVNLLEADTGNSIATLKLFSQEEEAIFAAANRAVADVEVRALAFSPDSSVLAVGTSIGQVKLFDARTGELMMSLDDVVRNAGNEKPLPKFLELRLAQGNVWSIAFSPPDGSLLATCGDAIDYFQDGIERLGLGPDSGLLKLWDAKTGELKQDLKGEHDSQVLDVAFSPPDGKFLASAGHWSGPQPGTGVKLWDPRAGKVTKVLAIPNGHLGGGSPLCMSFAPDGKRMAMGIMQYDKNTDVTSGSINVLYPASGILDLSWLVPSSVRPVAFSHDGTAIAAISDKNIVTLWDSTTGQPRQVIMPTEQPKGQRSEYVAFSPTANVLAISGMDAERGGFVESWNLDEATVEGKQ